MTTHGPDDVVIEVDRSTSRKLSDEQRARLAALAALPEDTIDTSDIAVLEEADWHRLPGNPLYRPVKKQTTVRLDADVLVWLRRSGKGWQTRLNAILRAAMLADTKKR